MKGITEQRLVELLEEAKKRRGFDDCGSGTADGHMWGLESAIDECAELTPWHMIESAPKDRDVLWYLPEYGKAVDSWSGIESNRPTHWQELPEDPK